MREMIAALVAGQTPGSMKERMDLQRHVIQQVAKWLRTRDYLYVTVRVAPLFAVLVPHVSAK